MKFFTRKSFYEMGELVVNKFVNGNLKKSTICKVLGLPMPKQDETYTKLYFAHDVEPGGVAIVSVNTSSPAVKTPQKRAVELADQAIGRGAKLLLSTTQIKDYPCLIVEDVFDAFCKIATYIRSQFNPKTIAITGSIGKTTTTQMVYSVLKEKYNTHRNDSSANNVRLAAAVIQRLKAEHEFYVQETMEGPPYGAASTIAKMVQPHAAIVTVVGSSHLESFGTQERILESCLGVQEGMPEDGLLILNGDDPFQWGVKCRCKSVYYAIDNVQADYRAENIRGDGACLAFDVVYGDNRVPVKIHCFGKHNVLNALAAFAAGVWAGMSASEIVAGLYSFRTVGIRQNLVQYGGRNLYLDCYNAAPESMQSSFQALEMIPIPKGGRRIAVLADILEGGDKEDVFHLEVGKMVAESCIDKLICFGKKARLIASAVLANSSMPVFHTEKRNELVDYLRNNVTDRDVTLFKGSHGMSLEHAVDLAFGTWFHEEYEQYEFRSHLHDGKDFTYRVYTDHATVIKKISIETDVVIPDYVEGKPVTGIARNVFNQSRYTRSVKFPESLINIRYCAFYKANHLREISLPSSIRIIDESAFNSCANLKTVQIEDGCEHIGYHAFYNCEKLESVIVPNSVNKIGNEAFANCKKLTIYGVPGSYAEQYANARKIPFKSI